VYSFRAMDNTVSVTGKMASVLMLEGNERDRARAERLSAELGLPLRQAGSDPKGEAVLVVSGGRLGVKAIEAGERDGPGASNFPDWGRIDTSSPSGRRARQPLLRAVQGRRGGRGLLVWDATAGWGEDAWILAALGHRVVAVERDPLIFRCLVDAWSRAAADAPIAARRIRPVQADSGAMLRRLAADPGAWQGPPPPDVVYLDPFFPVGKGRKARERKSVRILRLTAANVSDDATELLRSALLVAGSRVVLKRPPKARVLAPDGQEPVHSVDGRGFRYDIYISPRGSA